MGRPSKPWFRKSKNTWYVTIEGRKISLNIKGKENKAEAWKAWHRLMANDRPQQESKREVPTVATLVQAFLADAEGRLKPSTFQTYRCLLSPFTHIYGNLQANQVTPDLATAYTRNRSRPWSQNTRRDFLAVLSTAFRWAERTGLLPMNPLRWLRKPPIESRGSKALLRPEDHARLLEAAPDYFQPFLSLLYLTGARPGEIAAITAENFHEAAGVVILRDHKTARHGKVRILFLCPAAAQLLRQLKVRYGAGHLLRNRLGQPWTTNAVVHMMVRLRRKTGIPVTAYSYRHTYATMALTKGVPDAQVAALLGHSSTTMLHRHYAHLTAQAQLLRAVAAQVWGPVTSPPSCVGPGAAYSTPLLGESSGVPVQSEHISAFTLTGTGCKTV
jgi:integrase/recombinase XerC